MSCPPVRGLALEVMAPVTPVPKTTVDEHGHAIPLEYQGASVPRKMNQLGMGGAPVPGSLLTPDPPEETAALTRARHELALAEAALADGDQHAPNDEEFEAHRREALEGRAHEVAD